MTIAAELNKTIANVTSAYVKTALAGATQPSQKNLDNLPATIESIDAAVAQGMPPLTMSSASDYPARDYRVYGNSTQGGHEKNILAPRLVNVGSFGNGTVTSVSDEENSWTLSCWALNLLPASAVQGILMPNTTYTVSYKLKMIERASNTTEFKVPLRLHKSGSVDISLGDKTPSNLQNGDEVFCSKTFTTPSDMSGVALLSYSSYPTPYSKIQISELQIEEGSVATPFAPAPSPDYPQEIKSVGDLITEGENAGKYRVPITVSGKNLYMGSPNFDDTWANYARWIEDGTYNGMTVMKRARAWNGLYKEINVVAGKTYTFSVWVKVDQSRQVHIYMTGGTATASPKLWKEINPTTNWTRFSFTFTVTSSGTLRPRVEPTTDLDDYIYVAGYQFEEAATDSSYEPYHAPESIDIILDEPLRKVGDYADYIDFKNQKIVRNVRYLELPIANMDNGENYPGWKGQTQIKTDYPGVNDSFGVLGINTIGNITGVSNRLISINTRNEGIIWFNGGGEIFGHKTQTQIKADYPDLVFELAYRLANSEEESVDLLALQRFAGNPVTVSVGTKTQPSDVFVKF